MNEFGWQGRRRAVGVGKGRSGSGHARVGKRCWSRCWHGNVNVREGSDVGMLGVGVGLGVDMGVGMGVWVFGRGCGQCIDVAWAQEWGSAAGASSTRSTSVFAAAAAAGYRWARGRKGRCGMYMHM